MGYREVTVEVGEKGPSATLTPEQQLEYSEINAAWRHDDTMTTVLGSTMYPISFGAFFLAFSNPQARFALAAGSLSLSLVLFAWQSRLQAYTEARLNRARELEEVGCLEHHRRVYERVQGIAWYRGGIRVQHVRLMILALLIFGWIVALAVLQLRLPR